MAKLKVTKEKYGVPVSTRIPPALAFDLQKKAERLGISLAKYLSITLQHGEACQENEANEKEMYEDKIRDLKAQHKADMKLKENFGRAVVTEFIMSISKTKPEAKKHIENYNKIRDKKINEFYGD